MANSTATTGTAGSRTSQTSMPPGLITRSIDMACAAAGAREIRAPAASAITLRDRVR